MSAGMTEEDACYEWLRAAVTALPRRTAGQIAAETGMPVEDVASFISCIRADTDGMLRAARAIIRRHLERKRTELRATPPNPHDVEEAMRPYLGEVYDREQDAADLRQHPTPLERAYRAALDHLLDLNGVQRP